MGSAKDSVNFQPKTLATLSLILFKRFCFENNRPVFRAISQASLETVDLYLGQQLGLSWRLKQNFVETMMSCPKH